MSEEKKPRVLSKELVDLSDQGYRMSYEDQKTFLQAIVEGSSRLGIEAKKIKPKEVKKKAVPPKKPKPVGSRLTRVKKRRKG